MKFSSKQFLIGFGPAALCVLSGLAAAYSVYRYLIFLPPLIYTFTTIILFLVNGVKLKLPNLIGYCITMFLAYILVYAFTLLGMEYIPFSGLVACGYGAVISFMLVHFFIKKIAFNNWIVFFAGCFAFGIGDIFYFFTQIRNPEQQGIYQEVVSQFILAYFFWQMIVGILLFFTLKKAEVAPEPKLRSDYWFHSYI